MKTLLLLLLFTVPVFTQTIEEQVASFPDAKSYSILRDDRETTVIYHGNLDGLRFMLSANIPEANELPWFAIDFLTSERVEKLKLKIDGVTVVLFNDKETDLLPDAPDSMFLFKSKDWGKLLIAKKVEVQIGKLETRFDKNLLSVIQNLDSLHKVR